MPYGNGAVESTRREASHLARATAPPSRGWLSSVRRPKTSPGPKTSVFKKLAGDDSRRDSALAPSTSTTSADQAPSHHHRPSTPNSLRRTPSLPAITIQNAADVPRASSTASSLYSQPSFNPEQHENFHGIDTIIPTGDFDDLTSPSQVSFSKRGSMLLGGKRPAKPPKQLGLVEEGAPIEITPPEPTPQATTQPAPQKEQEPPEPEEPQEPKEVRELKELFSTPVTPRLSPRTPRSTSRLSARRGRAVSNRVLSTDEAMLSRKVRSMYKHGNESAAQWDDDEGGSVQNCYTGNSVVASPGNGSSLVEKDSSSFRSSPRDSVIIKEPTEIAGGLEDWTDIDGGEVDRYGFILPKKTTSGRPNQDGPDGPDEPRIQRVTTLLKLASEEPRRRGLGRSASKARSARSANPRPGSLLRRQSQRSSHGQGSGVSNHTPTTRRAQQRPLRHAANKLPHNRDRRLMDEASDMLKLPPGLEELAQQAEGGKAAQAMKEKEIEREEKWRKMAKVVQAGAQSGGMMFEFDVRDPKVISRTWKGIPDRWRGTAWYAFLSASAKAAKDSPTDEELVESFYALQEESSADDMQIDVDVPRTINRHIMFRRRYRGG